MSGASRTELDQELKRSTLQIAERLREKGLPRVLVFETQKNERKYWLWVTQEGAWNYRDSGFQDGTETMYFVISRKRLPFIFAKLSDSFFSELEKVFQASVKEIPSDSDYFEYEEKLGKILDLISMAQEERVEHTYLVLARELLRHMAEAITRLDEELLDQS